MVQSTEHDTLYLKRDGLQLQSGDLETWRPGDQACAGVEQMLISQCMQTPATATRHSNYIPILFQQLHISIQTLNHNHLSTTPK